MLDEVFVRLLVCPESKQPLMLADGETVARVNERVGVSLLKNRGGQPVTKPVDGLLVRQDGRFAYPVRDDIPVMLVDEAIEL